MPNLINTDIRRRAVLMLALDNCQNEKEANKLLAEFTAEEEVRRSWLNANAAEVSSMVKALCPSNVAGAGDPDGFFRVQKMDGFNFLKSRVTLRPNDSEDGTRPYTDNIEDGENDGWLGFDGTKQTIKFVRNNPDDEDVSLEEVELGEYMDPEDQVVDSEGQDIEDFYPM